MSDYESPIYLTDVEAEELFGVIAAYASDEDGHERPHGLRSVIEQLDRQLWGPSRWCDQGCGYKLPDEYKWHETTCGACVTTMGMGR
jgi:hypothetical protein